MSDASGSQAFFIGWDVGGWNCDQNPKSRDAIVILDENLALVGRPWRGNLRTVINRADSTSAWVQALFTLCKAHPPIEKTSITLAIDTPLGFSDAFLHLATGIKAVDILGDSKTNPYLFREAELTLFRRGLSPLSAIKDMIGSQATKGMHVLAHFVPNLAGCGVWTNGAGLTALEAYPSACKDSPTIQGLRHRFTAFDHVDKEDALTCALVAHLFATNRRALVEPGAEIPEREGWIWVPKDAFPHTLPEST